MSEFGFFDSAELILRAVRHRAECERAALYGLSDDAQLRRLGWVLRRRADARETILGAATGQSERARRLLASYRAARALGRTLVSRCGRGAPVELLGEAPLESGGVAMEGPCGARMARLAGLSDGWQDPGRRGLLRASNVALEPCSLEKIPSLLKKSMFAAAMPRGAVVLLLGRQVASLAGLGGVEPFEWRAVEWGGVGCYFPHPSGRSRWWNDRANVERAREFMEGLVGEVRARRTRDEAAPSGYRPRLPEESLSFVAEGVEPEWAIEWIREWSAERGVAA